MAARTARDISNLRQVGREWYVYADGYERSINELSRVELIKAAKLAFPTAMGNKWLGQGNAAILNAIRTETLPSDFDNMRTRGPARQTPIRVESLPEESISEDEDEETIPTMEEGKEDMTPSSVEDAIKALVESVGSKATVDEATVKAIVEREIANGLADAVSKAMDEAINDGRLTVRVEVKTKDGINESPRLAHKQLATVVKMLSAIDDEGLAINVFLPGPAGSGKSTLAKQAADMLGLSFEAMSFSPDTLTSKLFGYMDATGNYVGTPFRKCFENGGLMLFDEGDNANPGILAGLNQALANGYCSFPDRLVKVHENFRCIMTGNTYGRGGSKLYVGRNVLDAATLDRFAYVPCDVDEALEEALTMRYATDETETTVRQWLTKVRSLRSKAEELQLPIVVSPRSSIQGAMLLGMGFTMDEVLDYRLIGSWSMEVRSKMGL